MKKLLALCLFSLGALQVVSGDVRLELAGPQRPLISAGTGSKKIEVAVSGRLEGVKLHIIVREYAVKKILARSVPVTAKPKTEITIPLKQVGFYELTVIATESGKELERKTVNYAVVPEPDYDRPEEMGTCIHFAFSGKGIRGHFPYTFELLKLAGFTRIRDDLAWESIEKKPGKYEIPERLEQMINTVPEYGIKPLLVTGYNNGKAYPGKFKKSFPTTGEMREAFGNAVAYAVQYFGSRVTEWEIWNEPNSAHPVNDYLPLLKTVYPKIKAANPEATVISCGGGGAGGGPGGAMILPIANADGLRFMDGFSIHPYMSPGYDPDFGYSAKGSPIPRVSVPHFMEHLHRNFSRRKKTSRRYFPETVRYGSRLVRSASGRAAGDLYGTCAGGILRPSLSAGQGRKQRSGSHLLVRFSERRNRSVGTGTQFRIDPLGFFTETGISGGGSRRFHAAKPSVCKSDP